MVVQRSRSILGGREFLLRTDCQALRWIKTWSTSEGMVARWIACICGTTFRYEHRLRQYHTNADGLTKKTQYHAKGDPKPLIAASLPFMQQEQYDDLEPIENAEPPCAPQMMKQPNPIAVKYIRIKNIQGILKEMREFNTTINQELSRTFYRQDIPH